MIDSLKRWLETQQFAPGFAGMWVNPFYIARRGLHAEVACLAGRLRGRLLDVGCGQKPYRGLFVVDEYIGLEIDTTCNRERKQADYFYDGKEFPFADASFDCVLCNQVLEHVFEPSPFLAEIRRVLKPGGQLLLTVPFVWDEHEQPWDYARYTSFGLRHLLAMNGFQLQEQRRVNAGVYAITQLINGYLYKVLWTRHRWLNLGLCGVLMAPITLLGLLLGWVLPASTDLYLDQVVLGTRSDDE